MRLYIAVTDKDWFALHASMREVEEVNFWRPSPGATFKALQPGEILLFKLHSPDNFIAGGGFFTRFLQLPVNLVWDTFGESNGVRSQSEMRERIAYYRRRPITALARQPPDRLHPAGRAILLESGRLDSLSNRLQAEHRYWQRVRFRNRNRQGALARSVGTANAKSRGSSGAGNSYGCSD